MSKKHKTPSKILANMDSILDKMIKTVNDAEKREVKRTLIQQSKALNKEGEK